MSAVDTHREAAVTLASMSASPPANASPLPPKEPGSPLHTLSALDETMDVDGPTAIDMPSPLNPTSSEYSPSPTPHSTLGPVRRNKTTRGRKLAPLNREDIADLSPEEQAAVLKYSRKYQQKAATLIRAQRLPHHYTLTAKTVLKPCNTCASQDWPCVLAVINQFGIRKQISRCVGCRHTRSTCSLKESVHFWSEDSGMPWHSDGDDEHADDQDLGHGHSHDHDAIPATAGVCAPVASSWDGHFVRGMVPLTGPVTITIRHQNHVHPEIRSFLTKIGPSLHAVAPQVQSAVVELVSSLGGTITPQHVKPTLSHSAMSSDISTHTHTYNYNYRPATPPKHARAAGGSSSMFAPLSPAHTPTRHLDEFRPQYEREDRLRYAASPTESPVGQLKTPALTPVMEEPASPLYHHASLHAEGLGLDIPISNMYIKGRATSTDTFYTVVSDRGHYDNHSHHPTAPPLAPSRQGSPLPRKLPTKPAKAAVSDTAKPKAKSAIKSTFKVKRGPSSLFVRHRSRSPVSSTAADRDHLDHAETLLKMAQTPQQRSVSLPAATVPAGPSSYGGKADVRSVSASPAPAGQPAPRPARTCFWSTTK